MSALSSLDNHALLARLPGLRAVEREATAELIAHLGELDRRRLYTDAACSSLTAYCTERLGYSENEAQVRVAVARLAQRLPRVLEELRSGRIHLTGLFLLSGRLTSDNAGALLAEARGKSRRELERVLARWFPRPDVLPSVTPLPGPAATLLEQGAPASYPATMLEHGQAGQAPAPRQRVQPLSAQSYRIEFTASAELHEKLVQAQNLLGHALPSGDLGALFERALDALLEKEAKRRFGAGKRGKRRAATPKRREVTTGSRHVPVEVARVIWKRDGGQCTYVDTDGRRCSERRFVTVEHIQPHALGGPATVDNLCLLCSAHNALRARQVFGEDYVRKKIAEATKRKDATERTVATEGKPAPEPVADERPEQIQAALVRLGFRTAEARCAVQRVRSRGVEPGLEAFLRAALAELTPDVLRARC